MIAEQADALAAGLVDRSDGLVERAGPFRPAAVAGTRRDDHGGTGLGEADRDALAKGAISATPTKTVGDPEWANDPAYLEWLAFMKKYYPEGDIEDQLNFTGWNIAVLMTRVIEACGDDVSRQNIMKHATALKDLALPGLIPGIVVNTSPDDYRLITSLRPQRFDGERWVPISGTMAAR
jgi:hypothetical protein